MIKVALNLGGNGPLNLFPMVYESRTPESGRIASEKNQTCLAFWTGHKRATYILSVR